MGLRRWWKAHRERADDARRSVGLNQDQELIAAQVPELAGMSDVEGMAYTLQQIQWVQLFSAWVLHLAIPWIYLFAAPLQLPVIRETVPDQKKDPTDGLSPSRKIEGKNPFSKEE